MGSWVQRTIGKIVVPIAIEELQLLAEGGSTHESKSHSLFTNIAI